MLELLSLGERGLRRRVFNLKNETSAALYTAFQHLKIFSFLFFLVSKETTEKKKTKPRNATLCISDSTLKSASPVSVCVQSADVFFCYSGCSFSSMSDTRMFFSVCSARLELVRL